MTTDTFVKTCGFVEEIGGVPVRFGGMSKGAGMICPNMATVLGLITTDAAVTPDVLQKALTEAVEGFVQPDYGGRGYEHKRYVGRVGERHGWQSVGKATGRAGI